MALPHTIADGTGADVAELDANFVYLDDRAANINALAGGHTAVGTALPDPGLGNTRTGTQLRSEGGFYASCADSGSVINRNNDGGVLGFYRAGLSIGNISVTASAVSYNTTSDYRLKLSPVPLTGSGDFIDALQPCRWTWTVGGEGCGFIAHQLHAVSPSSVLGGKDATDPETGAPVYQSVAYASPELIANMVAELKSLRARLAAAGIA